MKSLLVVHDTANQRTCQADADTTGLTLLPSHLQEFDMALDEAVEGLTGAQQILIQLKTACISAQTGDIAPPEKLKVQRGVHHCARLLTEIQTLLQPLSLDLQRLMRQEVSFSEEEKRTPGKERH